MDRPRVIIVSPCWKRPARTRRLINNILAQNINGSGLTFDLGSTIGIEITASEVGFETTKQFRNHTLNIAKNFAPSGSMIRTDANLNTNGARSGKRQYR